MSVDKSLAIIGAGPKALAIAAKCCVLSQCGFSVPAVHIFEKNRVAANWVAGSGLTDGTLLLGTSPEEDIGFPYNTCFADQLLSDQINQKMLAYSFTAFMVAKKYFAKWVDKGKPRVSHKRWAEYLLWVFDKVKDQVVFHHVEIKEVSLLEKGWVLSAVNKDDVKTYYADSLMLTGPGVELTSIQSDPDRLLFTTKDFWLNLSKLTLSSVKNRVVIVGSGEQAASIALALTKKSQDYEIDIICSRGTAFTRGDSYSENRFYSDPVGAGWSDLPLSIREDFIKHTDIGVFSDHAMKILDKTDAIHYIYGACHKPPMRKAGRWLLAVDRANQTQFIQYDMVIFATGFDQLQWFNTMLSSDSIAEILSQTNLERWARSSVSALIGCDLSLSGLKSKLYWPMMASLNQGPGFSNLCCLGELSDRVLSSELSG